MAFSHELCIINAVVEVAWLKAHVGFIGNEMANTLAKWIYVKCPPQPNLILPPSPKGCISLNGIRVTNKLKSKEMSHVFSAHDHSALHQYSYDWYCHS